MSEAGKARERGNRGTAFRRLLRDYLRRHRRAVAFVVLFQTIQAIAALYLPTLNADVIDNGVLHGDTRYILRVGGLMLAVALLQIGCATVAIYHGSRTATYLGRDVRAALFSRVLSFSSRDLAGFGTPSLITRTTNDVLQVQTLTLLLCTLLVPAPIVCVGGVALALHQDVRLSSLLLVIVPILLAIVAALVRRMRALFRSMQERIDTINLILREQITGVRVVRAFVREARERARFADANTDLMAAGLGTGRIMAVLSPSILLVINAASIAVLWFGGRRVADGMPIGAMIAFLSYLMQILIAVMMATFVFALLPRAEVCAERILEVLETEPSIAQHRAPVAEMTTRGRLDLRDVGFRYPGAQEPVLRGVGLVARPGETTAVIGSTGAGKTTLLNLAARLMDADEGAILVNGVDVRRLDAQLLARTIGMVPQYPYLFGGTVATNLRYGRPGASEEELWHALEVAQAREFVEQLTGGLHARVGQGGSTLSGGQRQRLAIARMLVARPEICLFDDAFSALDHATDAALRRALAVEVADAAVVIVAQRVSTVRDAHRIIVLDEGRVAGSGTHRELLATCGVYREITLSQLTEAEAAA